MDIKRIMSDPATSPIPGYALYDPVDPFENHAGPFFWIPAYTAERGLLQCSTN